MLRTSLNLPLTIQYLALLLLLLLGPMPSMQTCPQGFTSTYGRCLFFNLTANVTWCAANRACADLDAELVTNWTVLQNLAAIIPGQAAWVGVSDLANERTANKGGWQYVNGRGTMPTSSAVWTSSDPNNLGGNQDCVAHETALIDKDCDHVGFGYVCELPDVPNTISCDNSGGSGSNRVRWVPAPPPTSAVYNTLAKYCFWQADNVLTSRDCAMLAGRRIYSRSFLYNSKLKVCHVTEFSDSQTQLEQLPKDWVKYVRG